MPRKKASVAITDGANSTSLTDTNASTTTVIQAIRRSTRIRTPSSLALAAAVASSASPSKRWLRRVSSASPKFTLSTKDSTSIKATGKKRARDDKDDVEDADGEPAPKRVKAGELALDALADEKEGEEEAIDKKSEKTVIVLHRDAAPVDPFCGMVHTHQVYKNGEGVFDVILNQADVGKNANKFYVIQLLHSIDNDINCTLFTRWGRVGEDGQQKKKGPFRVSTGVSEFKRLFRAKTGVRWEGRHDMLPRARKYSFLERDYTEDRSGKVGPSKGKELEKTKVPDSRLSSPIQVLCKLIFSARLMEDHLKSMQYDANKLPLGKLSKATIMKGFTALKALSEVIDDPNGDTAKNNGGFRAAVERLTGHYYSIIPHIFPRNARPTVIDDIVRLKRELDLVDALGEMEVASKLIASSILTDESGAPVNPMDAYFRSLRLMKMEPVDKRSKEFKGLKKYAHDTRNATHGQSKVEVQYAYRVERQEETNSWNVAGFDKLPDGDRLLLWHGSRTSNFAGILKQGLRIAPPEAPVTGYMFGKGVYFADMMSKSVKFCHADLSDNTGILLLCEVAAKPFYEQWMENCDAARDCRAANALCTKGLGRTQPAKWQDAGSTLRNNALKGCLMPKGPGKDVASPQGHLHHNEYIVYDPSQIRLRYLLMVRT